MQRLKQLGKDSLIYGLGSIAAKSIGLVVLPIYTRIFTPAEYGTIEMLGLTASLLSAFLVMGMDSAQSFYFFEQKKNGKESQATVVSAILQWRVSWGIGIVLLATVSSPLINAWLFRGELTWQFFALAFGASLFNCVMGQSVQIFRLLYRPWPFITITLTQTLLAAAIIIALVLIFDRGIIAFFIGSTVASLFAACLGWYLARDYIDFQKLHVAWWPRLLRFGLPLVPAGLAMYGMNASGRWFLQYYHGPEDLGIYAIGARFSLLFALVVETFRRAWWPIAMDSMHSDDGPATFRMIARLYVGVGVAAIIILTLVAPWLVQWLTGPRFHSAWPIIGILCWQSLFYGLFLAASAGMFKTEKTYINAYLMAAAAVLNIWLNTLLVPHYEGIGAAFATAATFLVWITASILISERLWKVGHRLSVFAAQVAVGAAVVAWLTFERGEYDLVTQCTIAILSASLLLVFSLDRDGRRQLLGVLRSK